jgi:hypothetical protein
VTLTDLIPSLGGKPRPRKANRIETRLRKAQEHLAAVREDNAKLLDWQAAADDFFAILMHDVVTTNAAVGLEQQLRAEAEHAAEQMLIERDNWRDEALALRARFGAQMAAEANAAAVTVPPMVRDTSAIEDQATGPIYVQTLWDALGTGPTAAVADPGRVPPSWARSEDDTASVPAVEPAPAEGVTS